MSLQACIEIVEKGDPDRFAVLMGAPVAQRAKLWPIYAFNVEVSRAPWASTEPMIAEMRVQWWADVLDEIATRKKVRRHEVASELAGVLDPNDAHILSELVEARRSDCYGEPLENETALWRYLSDTSGALCWAAARSIGAESSHEVAFRDIGTATGLANWFFAVPKLEARGHAPLPKDISIAAMAKRGQDMLAQHFPNIPKDLRAVSRTGWEAAITLRLAASNPAAVSGDLLHRSEFSRRAGLLRRVLFNSAG